MFKICFTSFIFLIFTACSPTSSIVLTQEKEPETLNKESITKIAIPVREHGYSNFDSMVLSSQNDLDQFLSEIKEQKGWNKRKNFIESLTLYPINFNKHNILLYRITESSGSTILAVDAPKGTNEHVIVEIGRDKPNIGTADVAYYALAYKIAKSVQDITFDNGIKKHFIKNKSLKITKEEKSDKE